MNIRAGLFLLCFSLLTACSSSGGGDDDPENASINSANARDLGTAATEGAKAAVDSDNAAQFGLRAAARDAVTNLTESVAREFALIPMAVLPNPCTSGGVTQDTLPGGDILLDYQMCEIAGATANGQVQLNASASGNLLTIEFDYQNFTITIGADVEAIDLSAVCVTNTSTFATSCTYSSVLLGIDNRTYSITGLNVSGDSISGYTVAATVTDPDHGIIVISTGNPILFNCTNSQPNSGDIQFSDDNGTLVTVTFNDCNSFTVSYSGTSTVYNW